MIDYKLLEALAMVITEGGFDKAAKKLFITQSAVSQRVKQLEDQHGVVLLQRTTPPQPTRAGVELLIHYRQVRQLESDLLAQQSLEEDKGFKSLAIGINADSLNTWFFHVVHPLLKEKQIVLDLHVDDQEQTHKLMQQGKVWGCISTREQPLQGCKVTPLGAVRYGIFSTADFHATWFKEGLTEENLLKAPMARFNTKDDLNQAMFLLITGKELLQTPTFYLPSTHIYAEFVEAGLCYGILPEQQSGPLVQEQKIINLSPEHYLDIQLYWHCWNLKSTLMEQFSTSFIKLAQQTLRR